MTQEQQAQVKKDALYAAEVAEEEVAAYRLRLSITGQHLARLAQALQEHPEYVTRLPDPHSLYDYTEGLKILRDGEGIIKMCEELRFAEQNAKAAKQRNDMFNLKVSDYLRQTSDQH